jgi:hypothetical protein
VLDENLCSSWEELYLSKCEEDEEKKKRFSEKARAFYHGKEQEKKAKGIKVIEPPIKPRAAVVPPLRYGAVSATSYSKSSTSNAR